MNEFNFPLKIKLPNLSNTYIIMKLLQKLLNSKSAERIRRNLGLKTGIYLTFKRFTPSASEQLRIARLLNFFNINYVIDIGANTGQFAESLFDFKYKGKVISFEPVSSAYNILVNRSKKYNNWEVAPRCAIGNFNKKTEINVSDFSVFSSILKIKKSHVTSKPSSKTINKETIDMYRLDDIIENYIDSKETSILLKIDTQGFEKEVLDGAINFLKRIKGIDIEIPLNPIYENTQFTFYESIEFLRKNKFKPYSFNIEGVNLTTGRVNTIDGLFFRE